MISSILNLVTDGLQRTCTGTINIDLQGSGWKTFETTPKYNTPGGGGGGTGELTTGEVTINTGSNNNGNVPEDGITGDYKEPVGVPMFPDNVHFGPAGIGLLIMGFLVLGCKYFNSQSGGAPQPPKKNWETFSDLLIKCILTILIVFNYQDTSTSSAEFMRFLKSQLLGSGR